MQCMIIDTAVDNHNDNAAAVDNDKAVSGNVRNYVLLTYILYFLLKRICPFKEFLIFLQILMHGIMEPWAFIFQLIPLGWRQCPAAVDPVKHSNKPRLLLPLARTFLGSADDKVTNVRRENESDN